MPEIPVVDLFAGAGGFGVATRLAGGKLCLSVEVDQTCCETLTANHRSRSHNIEQADVRSLNGSDLRSLSGLGRSAPLVVVGGAPCQPFSKAAYWLDPGTDARYRRARASGEVAPKPMPVKEPAQDARRDLLSEFRRLVTESRADGFVLENVSSLLHPRNVATFERLIAAFRGSGYRVCIVQSNAANYGVPQKRKRVFVLGSRHCRPSQPRITHRVARTDPSELPRGSWCRPRPRTVRSAEVLRGWRSGPG